MTDVPPLDTDDSPRARAWASKDLVVELRGPVPPGLTEDGRAVVGPDYLATLELMGHLLQEGLSPELHGTSVRLGLGEAVCRVRVDATWEGSTPLVPLWFDTLLPGLPPIVESYAVPGDGPHGGIRATTQAFLHGTLAPIRRYLGTPAADDGVLELQVTAATPSGGRRWDALVGGPLVQAEGGSGIADAASSSARSRPLLLDVADALAASLHDPGVHWVKCFTGRLRDGSPVGQVTIDNIDSPQGLASLQRRSLPGSGLVLVRQFALLRPVREGEPQRASACGAGLAGLLRRRR